MNGTALFLEPRGSLREALIERKQWLEQAMPGQIYCSDPPHCTLLFGDYGPISAWIERLRQTVKAFPAFQLSTDAWQEFPHDGLANGGHTVAYRIRQTSALMQLQLAVAEILALFHIAESVSHPLAEKDPFASSLRRFGFPFVGPHWIPHFTIGSPKVAPESAFLEQLKSGEVRHQFTASSISVWQVSGGRHDRLHELALAHSRTYPNLHGAPR